ncbi:hypothetical protein [Vibrio ouci]|uniref:Uncharacterized protein n=1 Tax=Vibrio ouci TaxID=2499078 RepID=A0A4Y8W962_9VIBR|nr:hypothetical protein [Vibrio ouci]TFH89480.1 hypothetical protein ELS82_22015 [Vibrio ouci]
MNKCIFPERSEVLVELCQLPRQSVCFQILTLIQMCHRELDGGSIGTRVHDGKVYYQFRCLKQYMANVKTISNAKTGLSALCDAEFLDRIVVSSADEVITDSAFFRGNVSVFYRLSQKGMLLFGLDE